MNEVNRLKTKLRNIGKNVVELRMSVQEAKALVAEFEGMEKRLLEKPVEVIKQEKIVITNVCK